MSTHGSDSQRTTVVRHPERARYDWETVNTILDEAPICHVGVVREGVPVVIPTIHARVDDTLYLHGSPLSGIARSAREGVELCVTATLLDGLVIARSPFHHSMNYRSVVVLGRARPVTDDREKERALRAVVEHVLPGRTAEVRASSAKEIAATSVLAIEITEASAKVRTGGPVDAPEDLVDGAWGGVVPLRLIAETPVADHATGAGRGAPTSVARRYAAGSNR